jgi:hypothetical protein
MLIGALLMSLSFFTRHFMPFSEDLTDLSKGMGVGIMIGGFILAKKREKDCPDKTVKS